MSRRRPAGPGAARRARRPDSRRPAGATGAASEAAVTEAVHPRSRDLDRCSSAHVVALLLDEEVGAARAVRRQAPAIARAAELFAATLAAGGRVVYVGAGTSGRLGALDAAELPPTFGLDPGRVVAVVAGGAAALRRAVEGAEDRPAEALAALRRLALDPCDLVCAIAASGTTRFTRAALAEARHRGARTVFVTCGEVASDSADVVIAIPVGPEVVAGSTRLKAGSATKLVLNAISTAAMVRLGKVWRGRMIDLRATNAKLRARALRIVCQLAGVGRSRAAALLRAADGRVRPALAAALLGVSVAEARRHLAAAGNRLADLAPH